MDLKTMKIGFIGGGNMAQALAAGFFTKGILTGSNVWVSCRTEKTLSKWTKFQVHTTLNNNEILENCEIIFLAVKPQQLKIVMQNIKVTLPSPTSNKLFISILVGVSLKTLSNELSSIARDSLRIVRSMPNTPAMVGEGIVVYCSQNITTEDEFLVETLFSCSGLTQKVPESLINAFSGLCGSSPAFVYLMIEALADGAVKMGVPRDLATKFAAQVMVGTGKMVLETQKHPGQLKDEVCSPGGTTIAGIHALESGSVRASIMNAIEASVNKANSFS